MPRIAENRRRGPITLWNTIPAVREQYKTARQNSLFLLLGRSLTAPGKKPKTVRNSAEQYETVRRTTARTTPSIADEWRGSVSLVQPGAPSVPPVLVTGINLTGAYRTGQRRIGVGAPSVSRVISTGRIQQYWDQAVWGSANVPPVLFHSGVTGSCDLRQSAYNSR
jgi:hypothetical protein